MSIMDIINPWGALRRQRAIQAELVDALTRARRLDDEALQAAHQRLGEVERELSVTKARALSATIRADRLTRLVARGHFRHPKTGRLGRRGETFE